MAAQTLTLAGKRFVILPESEYRKLSGASRGNGRTKTSKRPRKHRMTKQDWGDVAEAKRRLKAIADGKDKLIPHQQVRKELGLE
jgi:hypothetical protein